MRGARRKPIAPSSHAAGSTLRDPHQRAQPGLLRLREPRASRAGRRRGSRRRAESCRPSSPARSGPGAARRSDARAAQRFRELGDDAGAAEPGERVPRRAARDDGTSRERLAGPMMVGDDDVEAELASRAATSSTAVIPQSTVSTRSPPSSASRSASAGEPYPSSNRLGRCQSTAPRRARAAEHGPAPSRRSRRRRSRRARTSACPAATAARIRPDRSDHVPEHQGVVTGQRSVEEGPSGSVESPKPRRTSTLRGQLGSDPELPRRAHSTSARGTGSIFHARPAWAVEATARFGRHPIVGMSSTTSG